MDKKYPRRGWRFVGELTRGHGPKRAHRTPGGRPNDLSPEGFANPGEPSSHRRPQGHPPGRGSSYIRELSTKATSKRDRQTPSLAYARTHTHAHAMQAKNASTPRQSSTPLGRALVITQSSLPAFHKTAQHLTKPHNKSHRSCFFLKAPPSPPPPPPPQTAASPFPPTLCRRAARAPKPPPPLSVSVLFGSPLRELPSG
jgi:hypothetical protein